MLVDRIGGHLGDVLRRLGLNVEGDERVRDEVVDRLEPLLPDKVLPIVEQPVVEGLVTKPAAMEGRGHTKVKPAGETRMFLYCLLMVSAP